MDEFSLIQRFFSAPDTITSDNGVILGIGDDTAIIKAGVAEELLFTTDTLISGVHFPEDTDPAAIGHKALAVNLSDIAAMGGQARWFTLALSLPESDPDWLQGFSDGLLTLSKKYAVSLVGGDTTRGPLSITISAIGTIPDGRAIRRSGARAGDAIYVTGSPGMAAIGLAELKGEITLSDAEQRKYRNKLDYPQPRLLEGQYLRGYVSSMIDISDGLTADLGHILLASGCSAILDSDCLKAWEEAIPNLPEKTVIEAVLYGGDDYELLFTIPASQSVLLEQSWQESFPPLCRIGEITKGEGIMLKDSTGKLMKIATRGYNHFND